MAQLNSSFGNTDTRIVYPIYRSPTKVIMLNILFLAIVAWILNINWTMLTAEHVRLNGDMALGISVLVLLVGGWILRILPLLLHINRPAIVLSYDGITMRGKPMIRWDDVIENIWHTQSYLGVVTMGSSLKITGKSAKASCEAFTLLISGDEYFRQCDRFSSVGK